MNMFDEFLDDAFDDEGGHEFLDECCDVHQGSCGLSFYASVDGVVVRPRGDDVAFCRLVQSSEAGMRGCEAHFAGSAGAPCCDALEGVPVGSCHAGAASWSVSLGERGTIAACGGRIAGATGAEEVRRAAVELSLEAEDLLAAFEAMPEHAADTFACVTSTLATGFRRLDDYALKLSESEAGRETDKIRIRHARRELESLNAEYDTVSRETYAKNEEQIHANMLLRRQIAENREMFMSFIQALATAIDAKDPYTHNHSRRVTQLALIIGKEMSLGEDDTKVLEIAGYLHDLGKIGMPDSILNKPGRLDDEEFDVVKKHPAEGARILSGVKQLDAAAGILKHHHERFAGGGYPDGLVGGDIPLTSRILAVADTYDAITSDRPYRKGASGESAVVEIRKWSGLQFDPEIVDAFVRALEKNGPLDSEVPRDDGIGVLAAEPVGVGETGSS